MAGESGDALIIDPGSQADDIAEVIDANRWRVHGILNTHAHYDHVGAVKALQKRYNVPFYLHSADEALLKRANLYCMVFESKDPIQVPAISFDISSLPPSFAVGPFSVSWIATPGHTDGSVCFIAQNYIFSGDTLMHGAVGRTDLPGGNRERLIASLRKLLELPGEMVVCGGHGPRTTLEAEFSFGSRTWSLVQ
jgi:glyoxylase-like metal-dependent hydrolase (beta-lactamase superfamily II)